MNENVQFRRRTMDLNEVYLTVDQLSQRYSVSRATIYRWVKEKKMPKPTKIVGSSRWRLSTLTRCEREWDEAA
jgi:excisionase family DNA binding protein